MLHKLQSLDKHLAYHLSEAMQMCGVLEALQEELRHTELAILNSYLQVGDTIESFLLHEERLKARRMVLQELINVLEKLATKE